MLGLRYKLVNFGAGAGPSRESSGPPWGELGGDGRVDPGDRRVDPGRALLGATRAPLRSEESLGQARLGRKRKERARLRDGSARLRIRRGWGGAGGRHRASVERGAESCVGCLRGVGLGRKRKELARLRRGR